MGFKQAPTMNGLTQKQRICVMAMICLVFFSIGLSDAARMFHGVHGHSLQYGRSHTHPNTIQLQDHTHTHGPCLSCELFKHNRPDWASVMPRLPQHVSFVFQPFAFDDKTIPLFVIARYSIRAPPTA